MGSSVARRIRGIDPRVGDALLAALLVALDLVVLSRTTTPGARAPNALAVALLVAQSAPLVWRRTRPVLVLALCVAPFMAYNVIGFPGDIPQLAVLVALYSVVVYAPRRTAIITGAVAIPVLLGFVTLGIVVKDQLEPVDLIPNAMILAAICIVGSTLRARRAQSQALRLKAELLEKDREERAREAVRDERGRIARELHDVVTHSVSVMVVQAGAARKVLDTSPDQARAALVAVEATGQQALAEMRRLLGVLRTHDDATEALRPQPGIDQLERLLASMRNAGLPVEVTVEGQQRPLPTGVDLSAYRIVQEALTNTLKHAGPARAEVMIRYAPDALEVRVVDDGRGAAAVPSGNGSGHGLVGMRERVALFGGDLRAGPKAGGGFMVDARLPT